MNKNKGTSSKLVSGAELYSEDGKVELPKQELSAPERTGFTVVEWGGAEIK